MENYILQNTVGPLVLCGIQGTVTTLEPKLSYNNRIEFGLWQQQLGTAFYTGFHRKPPVYIIADSTRRADTSIITIGLDARISAELLKQTAGALGLCPRPADKSFAHRIMFELPQLEQMKVEEFTDLSRRTGIPLENAFGMIRYANFLTMQMGVERDDAMNPALEAHGPRRSELS